MPVRATICGEFAASSVISSDALRLPTASGLKITLIEHVEPEATFGTQLVDAEKSALLAPLTSMDVINNGSGPGFETVIVLAELAVPTEEASKLRIV